LNTNYIVYVIFDPVDGSPAYVGEGMSRDRPLTHLKAARGLSAKVVPFIVQLRKWLAAGLDIPIVIIRRGLHAGQSKYLEGRLIKVLGRRCNGTGCLWNVLPGEALGDEPGASAREPLRRRRAYIPVEAQLNRELRRIDPMRVSTVRRVKR
jgi:hypothetical protein